MRLALAMSHPSSRLAAPTQSSSAAASPHPNRRRGPPAFLRPDRQQPQPQPQPHSGRQAPGVPAHQADTLPDGDRLDELEVLLRQLTAQARDVAGRNGHVFCSG